MNRLIKSLLGLILLVGSFSASATHIVGGEIEVSRVSTTNPIYQFKLVLYFDKVNGNPGATDDDVTLGIYRKSDNRLMRTVSIPLADRVEVSYTNPDPACNNAAIQTDRLTYPSADIDLTGFTSSTGYYVVWERCCRNNIIDNIVVPDAPMMFYTEFPPVTITNSSPALFPPLRDYACANQPFYAIFTGDDPDGDSLVYKLSTPLAGNASAANPVPALLDPLPFPIPTVTFTNGHFSPNLMIKGNPPLEIDQNGVLYVVPESEGLFVFGVTCEEFRNGVKIGEVRRDYQLFVIPNCNRNAPTLTFDDPSNPNPTPIPGVVPTTTFTYTQGDLDTCLVISITDPDLNTRLNVQLNPLTHNSQNGITLQNLTDLNINPGEEAKIEICIPSCTNIVDEIYEVEVIVADNSCPQPLRDTALIRLDVRAPINNSPQDSIVTVGNPQVSLAPSGCYDAQVVVGDTLKFRVDAFDIDGDSIWLFAQSATEDLAALGIDFGIEKQDSAFQFDFEWIPTCENLGIGNNSKNIALELVVADVYGCGERSRDTICLNILLEQAPFINEIPRFENIVKVGLDQTSTNPIIYEDTVMMFENYTFNLESFDLDGDSLLLRAVGNGFDLSTYGMTFPSVIGNQVIGGVTRINSDFDWTPVCDNLDNLASGTLQQEFEIQFIATDYNDCFRETSDTLIVRLLLLFSPDDNAQPDLQLEEVNSQFTITPSGAYCDTITIGSSDNSISFNLIGSDTDTSEFVRISAVPDGFDLASVGMIFQTREKTLNPGDTVVAPFSWTPACGVLGANQSSQTYVIDFIIEDVNTCELKEYDTIQVKIVVQDKDVPDPDPFPNAFSPNGDSFNQTFTNPASNPWLPGDNCADEFVGIEIVDRWGKKVFESQAQNFEWTGEGHPSGVYYYHIKYRNTDYQGTVHLFRGGE